MASRMVTIEVSESADASVVTVLREEKYVKLVPLSASAKSLSAGADAGTPASGGVDFVIPTAKHRAGVVYISELEMISSSVDELHARIDATAQVRERYR